MEALIDFFLIFEKVFLSRLFGLFIIGFGVLFAQYLGEKCSAGNPTRDPNV